MVIFEDITYTVNEDDGSVDICVDSGVTDGFEANFSVSLKAMDGKAS